jgi:pimeloyl-ACP methyl ester carboxylesterase
MRRRILTWRILEDDLVGTYHVPAESKTGESGCDRRIGVLITNSGPAPRSGNSDLPVHIGDRLASRGIHVFRFDLPGLGDSTGSTPAEFHAYWREVLGGRNDDTTLALLLKLKQQFELTDIIVGGLCAAAVPTLRASDNCPGKIAGVILMEPAVRYGPENIPDLSKSETAYVLPLIGATKLRRALSVREWLRFLTGINGVERKLRPLRSFLIRIQLLLYGHTLHGDMNVPLYLKWRSIHAKGTHSFVAVSQGQDMDRCMGLIMDSLPAKGPGTINLVRIPHTNHILTSGLARDIAVDAVEQWVASRFTESH